MGFGALGRLQIVNYKCGILVVPSCLWLRAGLESFVHEGIVSETRRWLFSVPPHAGTATAGVA